MAAHDMKLVTIIVESLAREAIVRLLNDAGARGYTIFSVEGAGSHGERTAEIAEYGNIQVEVIVQPAVSERLMERLESEFFPRFAMIVYESDVRVRRSSKF
jgi:nitrogen regulatory protein PII